MKLVKLSSIALLFILPIAAADQQATAGNILDIIIPDNGFSEYLSLIKPRDTPQASTATADAPKTWVDSASALFRYLNKNYTETGKLQYVTDPDNPQFLRMIAQHIMDGTPLETKIGELTLEQQLGRVIERSTKAQLEIVETLRKVDTYRVPTHEGAKTMLYIVDSCYLALPNMQLIMAKNYLSRYIAVYKEDTLLNANVLSELKFIPSLIVAHKQIMQDANEKATSMPGVPGPQTPAPSSATLPVHPPRSNPIPIHSGTISRKIPAPAPQTSASEGQTPIHAAQHTEQPNMLSRRPSAEYRERARAKRATHEAIIAASVQPHSIATTPVEELEATCITPPNALDRQPLHAETSEQSSPELEQQSSE